MTMTQAETSIAEEAIRFAKANRKTIARRLTDSETYSAESDPVSVFMAGSPGAGKTEASIELLGRFRGWPILRIDPDELREEFPDYDGGNAWLFQAAVARLVDAVLDQALHKDLSFVLDGTFASYEVARKNVQRSLDDGRRVQILYVYQDPMLAWGFVQDREAAEGRRIRPEHFRPAIFRCPRGSEQAQGGTGQSDPRRLADEEQRQQPPLLYGGRGSDRFPHS